MGKYEPLASLLSARPDDTWEAPFETVEEVLGFPLPASARRHREWWANQRGGGHSQAKGWQEAGWQVWRVDLRAETVTFRRSAPKSPPMEPPQGDEALFARAASYLGYSNRERLVREALQALCEREAARRLARLGGSMPALEAAPRRRPEA
jgi:hypothetical protein